MSSTFTGFSEEDLKRIKLGQITLSSGKYNEHNIMNERK